MKDEWTIESMECCTTCLRGAVVDFCISLFTQHRISSMDTYVTSQTFRAFLVFLDTICIVLGVESFELALNDTHRIALQSNEEAFKCWPPILRLLAAEAGGSSSLRNRRRNGNERKLRLTFRQKSQDCRIAELSSSSRQEAGLLTFRRARLHEKRGSGPGWNRNLAFFGGCKLPLLHNINILVSSIEDSLLLSRWNRQFGPSLNSRVFDRRS